MGPGHRALGTASAAGALAVAEPRGVVTSALVVLAAVVTSGGTLSPDVDQTRAWRRITGGSGACAHRNVTHWWAWPVGLLVLSGRLDDVHLSALALGASVGWGSHLLGDALFGRRAVRAPRAGDSARSDARRAGGGRRRARSASRAHLRIGGALFGRGLLWRPAGVPLLPSRGHVGLGLPVGGRLEHWTTRALVAASWVLVPLAVSGLLPAVVERTWR